MLIAENSMTGQTYTYMCECIKKETKTEFLSSKIRFTTFGINMSSSVNNAINECRYHQRIENKAHCCY